MAKTAKQLGISSKERAALVKVRDGLRSGKFVHVKDVIGSTKAESKPVFNMDITMNNAYACGQAGCIGGWMAMQLGKRPGKASDYVYDNRPMSDLFFPPDIVDFATITPARAAKAIDSFLNTGDPNWSGRKKKAA